MREADLQRLMEPKVIAVVGASDTPGSQSALNYRMLKTWSEQLGRRVIPVNPNRTECDGDPCFASLTAIGEQVDVAVVVVGAAEEALRDAIDAGVPFVVIFTAGFAETGEDGAARQREIERLVATSNVRVLGPNTPLNAFQPFRDDLPHRRIGLITQSGHQGRPIYQAQQIGVALAGWAPTGNEADLESADFIRWFAGRDDVGAIAMYIEGFKDGRTLIDAASYAAERGVPIVAIKVGRSDIGRSWAQSHSGHLAGSDAITSAVFAQHGITRVDGLDELLEVSSMLARSAAPRANGIAIYSISGGTSAHMADWASSMGLTIPPLAAQTQAALREAIPSYLRVTNPIDSGGIATGDERGRLILDAVLDDPGIGALVVPIAGSFSPISDTLCADLVDAASRTDKPVCVIWGSPTADEPGYRDVLLTSKLPVFRSARNCLTAVKAWLDYHAFRERRASSPARPAEAFAPSAMLALRRGEALSEHRSKALIASYGIPVSRDVLCASADEAVAAAETIGYPVVMKPSAPDLMHKSDLGLVRVGVASAEEVRATYDALVAAARAETHVGLEGILVCEHVRGGVECVLGVVRDELFGPAIMFGLGGIAVEVFRDVTFRVPPFSRDDAIAMTEEIRAAPLLRGARGRPRASIDAIADAIMSLQRLALDLRDDLAELDVNPLVALPDRVVALDALVVAR